MRRNDEPPVLDWVPDRRTLVYRRPLSGFHPLYYIENWPAQGNLLFASEIKALFALGIPRRLHLAALDALLRYGFIPAPWTAFQDIQIVPAGSILRWQRAKTVLNQATDYHFEDQSDLSSATNGEQLHAELSNATAALLPPHDQLVALTGGGPASALTALLATQQAEAPFTIATLSSTDVDPRWQAIERIADACGSPLLAVTSLDQPDFWAATIAGTEAPARDTRALAVHQLLHTTALETQARSAISGLGAHVLLPTMTPYDEQTQWRQDTLAHYRQQLPTGEEKSSLWSQDTLHQLGTAERWEDTLHARKLARHAAQLANPQQAHYYLDLHLRLPDALVTPFSQLATQERLALRSPYLHPHVLDALTRLPENGFTKSNLLNSIVRHYLPEQPPTTFPLQLPLGSLYHHDSDLLQATLTPAALRATGLFDEHAVAELLQAEQPAAPPALIFVFTAQLLAQLFGASVQ
jgi:asparagine synthetase B (glutamine-hydrolysing)